MRTKDVNETQGVACSRRSFLKSGTVAAACGLVGLRGERAWAMPLGLPLGLQLYSVREMLGKDYAGTLKQVASLGYKEVEAAGFYGHSPSEVKAAMGAAGLSLVSAHYSANDLSKSFDETVAYCRELGLQYLICSFPGIKNPARLQDKSYRSVVDSFTMEDFRWNAERFNEWGRKVKSAGMQFGYHNHTMEFAPKEGVVPFDEMVRLTDPELVTFEMDAGWVSVGGGDPVAYLKKYPKRISMLHVKDFKTLPKGGDAGKPPEAVELGHGAMHLREVFAAARGGRIRHIFVEQEGFTMPPMESLRVDAEYMESFRS